MLCKYSSIFLAKSTQTKAHIKVKDNQSKLHSVMQKENIEQHLCAILGMFIASAKKRNTNKTVYKRKKQKLQFL